MFPDMKLLVLFVIVFPAMASSQGNEELHSTLTSTLAKRQGSRSRWNNDADIIGHGDEGNYYYSGDETDPDPPSPSLRGRDNVGNIEVISHYHFHKYILEDGYSKCVYQGAQCDPQSIKCCTRDKSRNFLECRGGTCNTCIPWRSRCTTGSTTTEPPCCGRYSCINSYCQVPHGFDGVG